MATPEEILATITDARSQFSILNEKDIEKLIDGCGCSGSKTTKCLYYLTKGLEYRYELSVFDETSDKLNDAIRNMIGTP